MVPFYVLFALAPLISTGVVVLAGVNVARISWFDEHGQVASGIVVGGESGSGFDQAIYCSEHVEFNDQHGTRRLATRSCSSSRPEKGAQVDVYYDPADPSRNHVAGSSGVWSSIVLIALNLPVALLFGGAIWSAFKSRVSRRAQPVSG